MNARSMSGRWCGVGWLSVMTCPADPCRTVTGDTAASTETSRDLWKPSDVLSRPTAAVVSDGGGGGGVFLGGGGGGGGGGGS